MATSTVRLEFICQFGDTQFIHNHSISQSLVTEANRAGKDGEYNERFSQVMMPLMKEHGVSKCVRGLLRKLRAICDRYPTESNMFLAHRPALHCGLGNVSMWKRAVRDRGEIGDANDRAGNAARGRGSR
ncbi:hypothetical protein VCV18_011457 [Metarhizium anisopliae]